MSSDAAVAREVTGAPDAQLLAHINRAQTLLERVPGERDRTTVSAWLSSSDEWRASATRMLSRTFEPEVVAEFTRAVKCRQRWDIPARALEPERRAVRNGMELLGALRDTQRGRELDRRGQIGRASCRERV